MDAEIGERREHFRGVVHFVEFPQQRHLVAEPVIEPVAELVGEEQHHGDDRARDVRRQRRGRHRADERDQAGDDAVRDELIGQDRPAEHHAEHEHVEEQIADVGLVRGVRMMRRGNSARAIVRQRRRRPRLMRCQTKNSAATTSAAASDVSEKCEPSENSSLPSWPKKNAMPAEKSNGNSRHDATGPMSYRRVKIALGDAPKSRLAQQIRVFRMLGDVAGDERAERLHRQALARARCRAGRAPARSRCRGR